MKCSRKTLVRFLVIFQSYSSLSLERFQSYSKSDSSQILVRFFGNHKQQFWQLFMPERIFSVSKVFLLASNFESDQGLGKRKSKQYQPSGKGGACSPPATPHRLQNPKCPPGGPKMADGVWVFGRSRQLSLNKFFDTSTLSMRKVEHGDKKRQKKS